MVYDFKRKNGHFSCTRFLTGSGIDTEAWVWPSWAVTTVRIKGKNRRKGPPSKNKRLGVNCPGLISYRNVTYKPKNYVAPKNI